MHKLVKPDGQVVEVNDNSLEYALSLGWKKQQAQSNQKGAKRGNSKHSNK